MTITAFNPTPIFDEVEEATGIQFYDPDFQYDDEPDELEALSPNARAFYNEMLPDPEVAAVPPRKEYYLVAGMVPDPPTEEFPAQPRSVFAQLPPSDGAVEPGEKPPRKGFRFFR